MDRIRDNIHSMPMRTVKSAANVTLHIIGLYNTVKFIVLASKNYEFPYNLQ